MLSDLRTTGAWSLDDSYNQQFTSWLDWLIFLSNFLYSSRGSRGPRSLFTICLFVFASKIQWEMAGPEQYSLVETSEERNLITSTNLPCEILLGWFMAEKFQSFTSSGFDARRFENTSTGLFALCLLSLVRSMGHGSRIISFSFSIRKYPNYWTRERISLYP